MEINLKEFRKKHNLTQSALAKMLGFRKGGASRISEIERGLIGISQRTAKRFAEV